MSPIPFFGPPNVPRMRSRRDVNGLIRALGYPKSGAIAIAAAEALGETRDTRSVVPLAEALRDSREAEMRIAAAAALGRIGGSAAANALGEALAGKLNDDRTRYQVIRSLGDTGDRAAVAHLIEAAGRLLQDTKRRADIQQAIVDAMSKLGTDAVFPSLVERLEVNHRFELDRRIALSLLNDLGWTPQSEMHRAIVSVLNGDWGQDVVLRAPVEVLVTDLYDHHDEYAAVSVLLRIGSDEAIEALVELATTMSGMVSSELRDVAAEAVIVAGSRAIDFLAPRATDRNGHVAAAATLLMGKIGGERAVRQLVIVMTGHSNISSTSAEDANPFVKSILETEQRANARSAAQALALTGPTAVAHLIAALQDQHIAASAAWSLGTIGDPSAIEPLVEALPPRGGDPSLRWAVAEALGRLNATSASDLLVRLLGDETVSKAALDSLVGLLKHHAESFSRATLEALVAIHHIDGTWRRRTTNWIGDSEVQDSERVTGRMDISELQRLANAALMRRD